MHLYSKRGLSLMLAGALTPLGAQELKDALRLLPPTTTSVEVYRNAALLNQRADKVATRFTAAPKDNFVTILPDLNLNLTTLPKGFTVVASFPQGETKGNRDVGLIPARNFPALVKSLKAVKVPGRYTFTRGKAKFSMVQRGTYAAISRDPALLLEIKGTGENLGEELTPLVPWISSHDTVLLAPSRTMGKAMTGMRSAMAPKAGSPPNALAAMKVLKPLVDMAEASVLQGALALDFPEDGSVQAHARVFLKAGSPMAQMSGDTPASGSPTMAGLPAQGFVLGGAWSISGPFRAWTEAFAGMAAEMTPAGTDSDKMAKAAALARALSAHVQGQSMSLGVPAKAGDPLLGQFRMLNRVDDSAAYMGDWTACIDNQIQAKLLPAGIEGTLVKDVLPGVPSASYNLTFNGLEALPLPPGQVKMILSTLFGQPDRITFSMAQLDSRTVVTVLGGARELTAALAPVVSGLDHDKGIAAIDALLPAQASFRYYVAVEGVRAMVQQVMESFVPGAAQKKLPPLPAVPPLALALHSDGLGLELSGAVTPETLDAMGAFVRSVDQVFPKKPEAAKTRP